MVGIRRKAGGGSYGVEVAKGSDLKRNRKVSMTWAQKAGDFFMCVERALFLFSLFVR